MFPDSKIVESFALGADKLRYLITYGIAPYFYDLLKDNVNNSDCYTVLFDGSLNRISETSQMDILLRYWDNITTVKVRFSNSSYLGYTTHKDLLEGFNSSVSDLDLSKIIQLSMDGPNVNWKFARTLSKDRTENGLSDLIDIGSCPLHIINGAFQTGSMTFSWNLKKILKAEWQIIHDSPARRGDFVSVTSSSVFPCHFVPHVGLKIKKLKTAILVWPHIVEIVRFWQKLVPTKQPKCKSYTTLKEAASGTLMIPKLQFFTYFASVLEPFLRLYQTDAPMIPFMYFDIKNLVKKTFCET